MKKTSSQREWILGVRTLRKTRTVSLVSFLSTLSKALEDGGIAME